MWHETAPRQSICDEYLAGDNLRVLGLRYGVSRSTISRSLEHWGIDRRAAASLPVAASTLDLERWIEMLTFGRDEEVADEMMAILEMVAEG